MIRERRRPARPEYSYMYAHTAARAQTSECEREVEATREARDKVT